MISNSSSAFGDINTINGTGSNAFGYANNISVAEACIRLSTA